MQVSFATHRSQRALLLSSLWVQFNAGCVPLTTCDRAVTTRNTMWYDVVAHPGHSAEVLALNLDPYCFHTPAV